MWSLLFCISSTSILAAAIAARTAFQRRSSSPVEIGVFRRSDMDISFSPGCGLAHDIDHGLGVVGEELAHIGFDSRHGTVFVALRIATEMREDRDVLGLPERIVGGQGLFREHVETGAGD